MTVRRRRASNDSALRARLHSTLDAALDAFPDMRIGQLVMNAQDHLGPIQRQTPLFYLEDTHLLDAIDVFTSERGRAEVER